MDEDARVEKERGGERESLLPSNDAVIAAVGRCKPRGISERLRRPSLPSADTTPQQEQGISSGVFAFCPVAGLPCVGVNCKQELVEGGCDEEGVTDEASAGSREVEEGAEDPGGYGCEACGAKLGSRSSLKRHVRLHASGVEAEREARARFSKLAVRRRSHRGGEEPFSCRACDATFPQSSALAEHLRSHLGRATPRPEGPFACDAHFAQSRSVAKHKRLHSGERPFPCDVCGARFARKHGLALHTRIHTGEKPYACGECDARFSNGSHLVAHRRSHTGERPYACDECDARFTRSSSLLKHRRSHAGERPYACDICHARFTCGSSLVAHGRLHTGERPYTCAVCDARFSQRSFLTKHARSHTGERPYACAACGRRYTQSSGLFKHRRSHAACTRTFPHGASLRPPD